MNLTSTVRKAESKFSVFEPDKTDTLKTGDIIPIKHLNGQSIPIPNLSSTRLVWILCIT